MIFDTNPAKLNLKAKTQELQCQKLVKSWKYLTSFNTVLGCFCCNDIEEVYISYMECGKSDDDFFQNYVQFLKDDSINQLERLSDALMLTKQRFNSFYVDVKKGKTFCIKELWLEFLVFLNKEIKNLHESEDFFIKLIEVFSGLVAFMIRKKDFLSIKVCLNVFEKENKNFEEFVRSEIIFEKCIELFNFISLHSDKIEQDTFYNFCDQIYGIVMKKQLSSSINEKSTAFVFLLQNSTKDLVERHEKNCKLEKKSKYSNLFIIKNKEIFTNIYVLSQLNKILSKNWILKAESEISNESLNKLEIIEGINQSKFYWFFPPIVKKLKLHEFKFFLKLSKRFPKFSQYFFKYIFNTFELLKNYVDFLIIDCMQPLEINFRKELKNESNLSIWISFFPMMNDGELFEIELSKSKKILIYLEDSHLYVELFGLSKTREERNFVVKDWNILGIFLKKINSNTHKYEIELHINKSEGFTIKISEYLVCKKISLKFDGKLEFLRIFNDIVKKTDLPYNQQKSDQNCSEVFCLNQKIYSYSKELFYHLPEFSALIKSDSTCFNIQIIIGSFYHFLPILETSNNPKNLERFCRILSNVLSMKSVQIPVKPNMIKWFRKILSSNRITNNSNLHDSLFNLIDKSTNHPNFSIIFENLMLNIDFWRNIDKNYLIEYLECVKIGFEKIEKKNSYQLLDIFFSFFNELLRLNYKQLVNQIYSYYFSIMFRIIKNVNKKSRFRILRDIILDLKDKTFISSEDFTNFLNLSCKLNWESNDQSDFSSILDSLSQPKSKLLKKKTIKPLLNLILINLKNFLFQRDLKKELKQKISILFNTKYHISLSEGLFEFFSNGIEDSDKISEIFEIYTKKLHCVDKQEFKQFEPSLNLFISSYKESKSFRKVVCSRTDFPIWLINLIDEKMIDNTVKNTIITVFRIPDCLRNLDGLRKIFGFLKDKNQNNEIIEILLQISQMINFRSPTLNYFREILNLCEDVLKLIPYKDLPKVNYVQLINQLVEKLENFEYSLNEVFKTKSQTTSIDRMNIDIRCGGITRQILIAVLYALSLDYNYFLEAFLLNLVSKTDSKHKKHSFENFQAHLLILTEWIEIFRKYEKENIELINLEASTNNFFTFLSKSEIMVQIKKHVKTITKSKILSKCLKSTEEKLHFFKYANEELRSEIEKSEHLEANLETFIYSESYKSILLENKIMKWLESKSSSSQKNIYNFCKYDKNFKEVEILFKGLSTLEINKISEKYTKYELFKAEKKIKRESSISFYSVIKNYSVISSFILSEDFIIKKRKKLEKFTGKIENLKSSKIRLRNFLDLTGKPIFFKSLKKIDTINSNFAQSDSRMYLNLKISNDEIIDQNISTKKLTKKLDSDIQYGLSKMQKDFACEIIRIEDSNFGTLSLKEKSIHFTSSSTKKPEINPILSTKNSKSPIFSSSALPETQSKQSIEKSWSYSKITKIQIKSFVHLRCSLELYLTTGKSILINFFYLSNLKNAYYSIKSKLNSLHIPISSIYKDLKNSKKEWIDGKLSNFDYLLILNTYASRSFNNLQQYPIFPWVLKDYKSEKIDLNDPNIYRNFKLPVPAQTPRSYSLINESYGNSKHDPAGLYHYGAHYSSGALVLNYLVRVEPFTRQNKILNSGSFDLPDRIFYSVSNSWKYGQKIFNDPKELIPEFFYLPEMFVNRNNEDFGNRQRGEKVDDVKLPKWANGQVYKFLFVHRMALESDYVSENLNHWIDLVFGYEQQGERAFRKYNLFHPITYENNYFKIMNESDDGFKPLYYRQAILFGQTPDKLFDDPHPPRKTNPNKNNQLNNLISGQPYESQTIFQSESEIIISHIDTHIFFIFSSPEVHYIEFRPDLNTIKSPKLPSKIKLQNTNNLITSLKATIFKNSLNENFIITAGYINNIILIHNMTGFLTKKLDYHNDIIISLIGGSSIISASTDSKIISWTTSKEISYEGHTSPILSINIIKSSGILVSSSDHLLLHSMSSGKALIKIKEKFLKLLTNSLGFICAANEKELKIFYINGDLIIKYQINSSSLLLFHLDTLIYKQSDTLQSLKLFDDNSKNLINLSTKELTKITYIEETSTLLLSASTSCSYHSILSLYSLNQN